MRKQLAPLRTPPTTELKALFYISDARTPKPFFLMPVHYRTRSRYYHDALKGAWKRIEKLYESYTFKYPTLQDFAASKDAEYWWRTPFLPAWEFADIIGYLEARYDAEQKCIRLVCYKTIKRPSRLLTDRTMVPAFDMEEPVPSGATTGTITSILLSLLDKAKAHHALKARCVDARHLRDLLPCVDWVRYISI